MRKVRTTAAETRGPTARDRAIVKVGGTVAFLLFAGFFVALAINSFGEGSYFFGGIDLLIVAYALARAYGFARGTVGTPLVAWLASRR
ncbi:hypothetical protein [Demetria terragena]|uniref:hypothetical protein n=1 Tax=Demetria terragena TaxID=63959 RepID=UPI00036EDCAE|nr:hypothetical protein [Demetria terragena]